MKLQEFYKQHETKTKYIPGITQDKLAEKIGINKNNILKLDANENLFLDKGFIQNIVSEASNECDSRIYPSSELTELYSVLAKTLRINEEQIVIDASSDQIIDLLFNIIPEGKEILAVTPTFSMYKHTAIKKRLVFKEVDLSEGFHFDADKVLAETSEKTKMIIICSPNNPTGNQYQKNQVLKIIKEFPEIVLVDEAYVEYASYSLKDECSIQDNLIILRTFSKAFGLAGLRMGYAITNKRLAEILKTEYQLPYPLSSVSLRSGIKVLENSDKIKTVITETKQVRTWLFNELKKIKGVIPFRSDTNFILFDVGSNFELVYQKLLDKGIIIRKIGEVSKYKGTLRVTVAPQKYMDKFIYELRDALK
ncbi:histidinol-phosphate transaminase [Candidatus Bathyarchaeota archaeon]|nr:histidinol-phosphate transaminase [Candidatus Bathyarchaeota archaeon]